MRPTEADAAAASAASGVTRGTVPVPDTPDVPDVPDAPDAPWRALRRRIAAAGDLDELAAAARGIPEAAAARAAGLGATAADAARTDAVEALTQAISALNDEVTCRVVQAVAADRGVDLGQACWLAFGSQARGEQTLVTDQDNGLVFAAEGDAQAAARRPHWQAFGQRVNEALAACGYPLCDGQVMAGQPLCCLAPHEWCRRFEHWMAHGDGNDLFAARIYFDVRPLAGNAALAEPLVALLRSPAAALPRFVRQLADIVLARPLPLNWLGQVATTRRDGELMFDLKLNGTTLFVDAARLWALAHRLGELGTAPRLQAAARALHVPEREAGQWVGGFLTLQRLRLASQRLRLGEDTAARAWVPWRALDARSRSELKQALRAARVVRQRIELDYWR